MAMTSQQILAAIAASPALQALAAAGNTQAIADALSVDAQGKPKMKLRKTEIGVGTVLAAFGGIGGEFIDTLAAIGQTNRDVYWLLEGSIKRGVFDTGIPASRAGIQGLMQSPALSRFVPGMQALLDMGQEPDPVTKDSVQSALLDKWTGSTWTGSVTLSEIRNGMVYVTITYTSSTGVVRVENTFGDDLTPVKVQEIISRRVESLKRSDAALALFGS